ncbi:hypothetical protein KXV22_002196 [Aspergillus fumigatus]|nr:hypothetical protein KXX58_003003 [Aspergillus fumigatus]KAH1553105.1 hypothetical protein KXX57_007048 [Aspergillus fumigatus]KAH1741060.1 hypothetical protein KXX09_002467 [Aspergillus fumigatus]KAH2029117.1 hypothetical protein KXV65_004731 [Aspergillus fumigatus]KAH2071621.1 hypothetical protein KXW21_001165 [Aspergillus fumigatus]
MSPTYKNDSGFPAPKVLSRRTVSQPHPRVGVVWLVIGPTDTSLAREFLGCAPIPVGPMGWRGQTRAELDATIKLPVPMLPPARSWRAARSSSLPGHAPGVSLKEPQILGSE